MIIDPEQLLSMIQNNKNENNGPELNTDID